MDELAYAYTISTPKTPGIYIGGFLFVIINAVLTHHRSRSLIPQPQCVWHQKRCLSALL